MRKIALYLKHELLVKLAGVVVSCAVLWGCVYPDVDLKQYGQTVRFHFLLEGTPASGTEEAASAAFVGQPSQSVLPGSFTPPAGYKISVRPQSTPSAPAQTAYIAAGTAGSIAIPAVTNLTVDVDAYSTWADTSIPPAAEHCILQKTGILFSAADVAGGVLQIKLNPLTDKVTGTTGSISLKLAWPADLDVDNRTDGYQGITKITADLYDFSTNAAITGSTQDIISFSEEPIGGPVHKTAMVVYSSEDAGTYKLRLAFFKSGNIQIGQFTEAVTVWPGSTADKWIDAAGTLTNMRLFTSAEFYSAAAAVDSISVKKGGTELPKENLIADGSSKVIKVPLTASETIQFKIKYDADGAPMSGKSLKWVKAFVNGDTSGSNLTGFAYAYEGGGYVSNGTISVPSALDYYRIDVCIQAPDRVTTKTYSFTFGTIMLSGTPPSYYVSLAGAIGAAASTDVNAPDVITVLEDVSMTTTAITAIAAAWPSGTTKHIKITTPANITRKLLRTQAGGGAFFTIRNPSSLTLEGNGTGRLTLDGGAVWTGGSATPPSPAYGAANSGLAGGAHGLIQIKSGTLKILDNVSLQNNMADSDGGAINIEQEGGTTGTVTIDGANTVIAYNRSYYSGGGVRLQNSMTLNLINGIIHNNHTFWGGSNGGGVKQSDDSTFTMSAGMIQNNTAASGNGGGVYIDGSGSTFAMSGVAQVDSSNDVYLPNGKKIKINSDLTTPLPHFAAVIKPQTYGTIQVLEGDSSLISANHNRFGVMPNGGTSYDVDSAGYLASRPAAVTVYWLGAETTDAAGKIAGSSGTFIVPAGKTARVFMVGGGGSGAACNNGNLMGGGSGGQTVTLTGLTAGIYSWSIGNGGATVSSGNWTPGNSGGNTTFGSGNTATGGSGGSMVSALNDGTNGTACPFASSFPVGWIYNSFMLSTALFGAGGGDAQAGPIFKNGGTTGGGNGGQANASFYGAGGAGRPYNNLSGTGHKGVIFVKLE